MTKRRWMRMFGRFAVSVFALAAMLGGGIARADTLTLGGTYQSVNLTVNGVSENNVGSGSIGPSSLNGNTLAWVYCVDLFDDIGVPATYSTTVNYNGVITSESNSAAALGLTSGVVNNAGEVAWLLDHYAAGATSSDAQAALQAAIWHVIYGSYVTLGSGNDTTIVTDYNSDLAALGTNTAALSTIAWLSPSNGSGPEQGLVTTVPEPSTSSIMFIGLVFLGLMSKRLVRGNHPETQTNC